MLLVTTLMDYINTSTAASSLQNKINFIAEIQVTVAFPFPVFVVSLSDRE